MQTAITQGVAHSRRPRSPVMRRPRSPVVQEITAPAGGYAADGPQRR